MAKGWHKEPVRHREAALKGLGSRGGHVAPTERGSSTKGAILNKIIVKRMPDEDPDLSYLETTPEYHYGKDGANWNHVSQAEKDKVIKQYGSLWDASVAYAKQDKKRLESYGRSWSMMGIRAEAEIQVPMGSGTSILQTVTSGGLYGIEDDSDEKYLREEEDGQIAELKKILRTMGVKGIDKAPVQR